MAAGLRPTTHSGRPPIDRRASARPRDAPPSNVALPTGAVAEIAVLVVMVFWAGNFIVVKGALDGPAADRVHVPPVRAGLDDPARAPALARGHAPAAARATLAPSGAPRHPRVRHLPDPVDHRRSTRISAGDSALLIAATPVLTALIAVAIGSDTLTPPKLVGALVSFVGVVVVVGAGAGLTLPAIAVGYLLTLLAAVCWATYTRVRRPGPAAPLAARATAWATVAGTAFLAPLGVVQLVGGRGLDDRRRESCSRSSTRVRWPRGSRTSSSSTGSASSGRPA